MNLYNTTELFQTMTAAEDAFAADDMNLDKLNAADAAFAAYHTELAKRRAEWNALPAGDRKDSAEQNAFDTEGTAVDQLRWFEIAIGTFDMDDCTR